MFLGARGAPTCGLRSLDGFCLYRLRRCYIRRAFRRSLSASCLPRHLPHPRGSRARVTCAARASLRSRGIHSLRGDTFRRKSPKPFCPIVAPHPNALARWGGVPCMHPGHAGTARPLGGAEVHWTSAKTPPLPRSARGFFDSTFPLRHPAPRKSPGHTSLYARSPLRGPPVYCEKRAPPGRAPYGPCPRRPAVLGATQGATPNLKTKNPKPVFEGFDVLVLTFPPFRRAEHRRPGRIRPAWHYHAGRAWDARVGRRTGMCCRPTPPRPRSAGGFAPEGRRFFGYFLVATRKYPARGAGTAIKKPSPPAIPVQFSIPV